jgi:hypothetical protein
VVQEAFMESFHSLETHPQIMSYIDAIGCQYDARDDKSDTKRIEGLYYNVFPNLMHWCGYGPNMWYRFRP